MVKCWRCRISTLLFLWWNYCCDTCRPKLTNCRGWPPNALAWCKWRVIASKSLLCTVRDQVMMVFVFRSLVGKGLDGIIHNACQTIKRPQSFYEHLRSIETNPELYLANAKVRAPADNSSKNDESNSDATGPDGAMDLRGHVLRFTSMHGQNIARLSDNSATSTVTGNESQDATADPEPQSDSSALASADPINPAFPQGCFDVHGQQLDLRRENSWVSVETLLQSDKCRPQNLKTICVMFSHVCRCKNWAKFTLEKLLSAWQSMPSLRSPSTRSWWS